MPFKSLAADDIFISYTRLDASTYAAGLADELTKKGFSCFIDKLGTDPDKDLPDMLLRKLKSPLSPGEKRPEFTTGEFGLQFLSDESSEYIGLRDLYGVRPREIRVEIKHTPSAPRAVSPDGRTLAIGDSVARPWNISEVEPTSIMLWDISDKAHPRKLNTLNFDGRPASLSFGDDGATLAASYDNGRIVLWDYVKGTRRKQILVPETRILECGRAHNAGRVALSPDGRLLAAKSDGPISVWDVETGLLLGRLGPESYPFRVADDYPSGSMVFSRDGKVLVVAGGYSDGGIDLWNLDPEAWATMASSITGRRK
jgi:WD40 repeat protein